MEAEKALCVKLLQLFGIAKGIELREVQNLKVYKSQSHALGPVYAFDYRNKHYYAVDDYSLDGEPDYAKNILLDINHLLKGRIMKRLDPQTGDTTYAVNVNEAEYYLWESPGR